MAPSLATRIRVASLFVGFAFGFTHKAASSDGTFAVPPRLLGIENFNAKWYFVASFYIPDLYRAPVPPRYPLDFDILAPSSFFQFRDPELCLLLLDGR